MRKLKNILSDSWPILILLGVICVILTIFLVLVGVINSPKTSEFFDRPLSQIKCGEFVLILFIAGLIFTPSKRD